MSGRISAFRPVLMATLLTGALLGGAKADSSGSMNHMNHGALSAPRASGVPSDIPWNEAASRELEVELHRLHEIWNTGDIASLKKFIIGDDVLPTFELDPRSHQAITLSSKEDLDRFVSNITTTQVNRNVVTRLDAPVVRCHATTTWGVCTEECTVNYDRADTGERLAVDKLRATQIAVKTADGWRWIQWHMSDTRPPQSVSLP